MAEDERLIRLAFPGQSGIRLGNAGGTGGTGTDDAQYLIRLRIIQLRGARNGLRRNFGLHFLSLRLIFPDRALLDSLPVQRSLSSTLAQDHRKYRILLDRTFPAQSIRLHI
jgi:hypothetical protein